MKKYLFICFIICVILFLASCTPKNNRSVTITHTEDGKIVNVQFGDSSLVKDTVYTVPLRMPDSTIIEKVHYYEDSVLLAKARADSLRILFIQDSINFRRITLLINGGYNGWDDRYKRWLQAREAIMNLNEN